MNKLSMTLTAVAAVLGLTPALSQAASSDPMAQQCFKAFETRLSQKFTPAPRVQDTHVLGSSFASGLEQTSVVEYKMTATNPRNHAEVLRASCLVNSAGVISLTETTPSSL
jgi:hypothetical protein